MATLGQVTKLEYNDRLRKHVNVKFVEGDNCNFVMEENILILRRENLIFWRKGP